MRLNVCHRPIIFLAALGSAQLASAIEPIPSVPVILDSLPKQHSRFSEPPRSELIAGTRLVLPAGPAVKVDRFEFVGATAIPAAELGERLASFAHRALTSTDLDAAAEEVAKLYRSRGYPLAAATLAAPVNNGVATLQVYEGRLGSIRVDGNDRYATEAVLYPTTDLPRGQPLTDGQLEPALLVLDDMPGLDVQGQGVPSKAIGESDLVLKVTEDPWQFTMSTDNNGVESVGRERYTFDVTANSITGWGDQLVVGFMSADLGGLNDTHASYSAAVDNNIRAGLSYNSIHYEVVADGIANLDIAGHAGIFRGWISVATSRTRAFSREVRFNYEVIDGKSTSGNGAVVLENVSLKTIGFAVYDSSWGEDGTGWTRNWEFDTNLQDNPGTDPSAHLGQLRFTGFNLSAVGDWQIQTKLRGVYSLDAVVDLKKFRVGGPDSVRAYDWSQEVGDGGFDASVDFLAPLGNSKNIRTQLAFFADMGWTTNHAGPGVIALDSGLIGGAGMGWHLTSRACKVYLDYAYPVGQRATADGDRNGYFWGRLSVAF